MDGDEDLDSGQTGQESETGEDPKREEASESLADAIADALGVDDSAEGEGDERRGGEGRDREADEGGDDADRGVVPKQSADRASDVRDGESGGDREGAVEGEADFLTAPEGINGRAKRRFDDLASRYTQRDTEYKALETQHQQLQQHFTAFAQEVQSTGATPEKFNTGLEYMRIVNNPRASEPQLRAAKQLIESELRGLNARLGETSSASEAEALINQFPDLRAAIDNMQIDEQYAAQIAGARVREQQRQHSERQAQQAYQAQAEQHQQAQAMQGRYQAGGAAVQQWINARVAADPSAQAIIKGITPMLVDMARSGTPPESWVTLLESSFNAQRQAIVAANPPPPRHEQPLSGGSSSAGRPAPKTMQDALLQRFNLE